ncbi:hypothetical protein NECAME_08263 [Necator americanus]|uniref:Uncharacterized protein n=1 Tax=Necator americanus TaxID=51031 RepID=W2TLD9_NECAM|nr:hypothetical protein NECAME_08263 [Necator americanus]ETN81961.1 hypothetical protein NECAME_08263 [Necator americanus]
MFNGPCDVVSGSNQGGARRRWAATSCCRRRVEPPSFLFDLLLFDDQADFSATFVSQLRTSFKLLIGAKSAQGHGDTSVISEGQAAKRKTELCPPKSSTPDSQKMRKQDGRAHVHIFDDAIRGQLVHNPPTFISDVPRGPGPRFSGPKRGWKMGCMTGTPLFREKIINDKKVVPGGYIYDITRSCSVEDKFVRHYGYSEKKCVVYVT